jgi:hypothetical protein
MAQIKPSEPLFLDLISTADLGADDYDGFVLDSSVPSKSGRGDAMAGNGGELLARPILLRFPIQKFLHDLDDGSYPF